MKPATIILAMLGAAQTAFGAPIEDMNAIEEVNGTLIEDSFDMPLKRVNNARTAIYTAWTGTSNNGRGCTGGQQGSTADQIGDGGSKSCSTCLSMDFSDSTPFRSRLLLVCTRFWLRPLTGLYAGRWNLHGLYVPIGRLYGTTNTLSREPRYRQQDLQFSVI